MKFKNEWLKELLDVDKNEETDEGLTKLKDISCGSRRRWEDAREVIFSFEGKLYIGGYSVSLTEYQDSQLFGSAEEVECLEAEAYEVKVVKYRVKQ